MRGFLGVGLITAALLAAVAASAAPGVAIRNAVVDVIVLPEARSDVRVEILRSHPRLPLRVSSFLGRTTVDGGLWSRIRGCSGGPAGQSANVLGVGRVRPADAPQILIRTPLDVRVAAEGAVWGRIGHANSVDLVNASCGAWMVANVRGQLNVSQVGSGETRTGQAGSAELTAAGSGTIATHEVFGAVKASSVGSGQIEVGAVNGPLKANVAGGGRVQIDGGHASSMEASIAGSGDIAMAGEAGALKASVVGSGEVRVARVAGPVSKAVVGSGDVRIGS